VRPLLGCVLLALTAGCSAGGSGSATRDADSDAGAIAHRQLEPYRLQYE
jgi:hypothetical protein